MNNDENDKKVGANQKRKKSDSRAIFIEEERQFLQGKVASIRYDDTTHNRKYMIRVKAKKAFKEDIPLILKNADWIFDGEEEPFFYNRLFDVIKDLYIVHRNQLKQEREKAKVKSTVSQREIWKRVNQTIREARNQVQTFWKEVDGTQ